MTANNPGTAKIIITQSGNSKYKAIVKNVTVKVPRLQSRRDAIQPWYDAMQAQRKASWNSYYKWTRPTINNSKKQGTCITFPSVSAQRAGLIKSKYDLGASDGANGSRKSDVKKAIKSINSKYWTYWWKPGGTTKQLVKKGKILPGDVLGCSKHSYVYAGKSKTGALLYNHSGKPAVNSSNIYPDVETGNWYVNAVLWAKEKDIANGYGDGTFGIGDQVTREAFALMLYKYAVLNQLSLTTDDSAIESYADTESVSGWAKSAMNWAVTQGIITGKGEGDNISDYKLDPQGNATRAECASMIMKLLTMGQ